MEQAFRVCVRTLLIQRKGKNLTAGPELGLNPAPEARNELAQAVKACSTLVIFSNTDEAAWFLCPTRMRGSVRLRRSGCALHPAIVESPYEACR